MQQYNIHMYSASTLCIIITTYILHTQILDTIIVYLRHNILITYHDPQWLVLYYQYTPPRYYSLCWLVLLASYQYYSSTDRLLYSISIVRYIYHTYIQVYIHIYVPQYIPVTSGEQYNTSSISMYTVYTVVYVYVCIRYVVVYQYHTIYVEVCGILYTTSQLVYHIY